MVYNMVSKGMVTAEGTANTQAQRREGTQVYVKWSKYLSTAAA